MRALIHGLPGTGKNRVIKWIRRIFMEAREWTHGVEFLCVAFQNKVAYAMGGSTLHSAGDLPIGGSSNAGKLAHQDINEVFTRNQHLRWLLIDECFMIPDDLLGLFSVALQDAASDNRFLKRLDGSMRPFGGYNTLFFGDLLQIPPLPPISALFVPPPKKTEAARTALLQSTHRRVWRRIGQARPHGDDDNVCHSVPSAPCDYYSHFACVFTAAVSARLPARSVLLAQTTASPLWSTS